MVWLGKALLEEPALYRQQRKGSSLIGRSRLFRSGSSQGRGHRRHCGNGLPFHQLLGRYLVATLTRARDDLQAEDGVTTQLKEVVVTPHLLAADHVSPDLCQCLLCFTLGRFKGFTTTGLHWLGQRLAI